MCTLVPLVSTTTRNIARPTVEKLSSARQVAYARWMHLGTTILCKYAGCPEPADNNGPGSCSKSEERGCYGNRRRSTAHHTGAERRQAAMDAANVPKKLDAMDAADV
jgi:hypothetical protein